MPKVVTISSTPTKLVVVLRAGSLHLNIVVAHAPHSGHSKQHIIHWWQDLEEDVANFDDSKDLVALLDSSAQIGSQHNSAVGDQQPEEETLMEPFCTSLCLAIVFARRKLFSRFTALHLDQFHW